VLTFYRTLFSVCSSSVGPAQACCDPTKMAAPLRPSSLLLAGLLLVVLLLLPLGARANSQTELNEDND